MPMTFYTDNEYQVLEKKLKAADRQNGELSAKVASLKNQLEKVTSQRDQLMKDVKRLKTDPISAKADFKEWCRGAHRILDNMGFKIDEITNEEELRNWYEDNLRPEEAVSEMFKP